MDARMVMNLVSEAVGKGECPAIRLKGSDEWTRVATAEQTRDANTICFSFAEGGDARLYADTNEIAAIETRPLGQIDVDFR